MFCTLSAYQVQIGRVQRNDLALPEKTLAGQVICQFHATAQFLLDLPKLFTQVHLLVFEASAQAAASSASAFPPS